MIVLPRARSALLAQIDATDPQWASEMERVRERLAGLAAEEYLVDGPAAHPGEDRPWVRIYSVGDATSRRWHDFLQARRVSYATALAALPKVQEMLALLGEAYVGEEMRGRQSRLLPGSDTGLKAVVGRTAMGQPPTESEWVVDIPRTADEDMVWIWAAANVLSTRRESDEPARCPAKS